MTFKNNKENLFNTSMKSGIYVITCLKNNKHYVGQSEKVISRLNAHKNKLRRQIHENKDLQTDFIQYGEPFFKFQPLIFGKSLSKAKRLTFETLILETLSPNLRYNVYIDWKKRFDYINPFYNKSHTAEARKLQSVARKDKQSNFYGHTQSNEVKKIVSLSNAGKSDRRKPILIDNIYYESISEAFEKLGLSRRLIRQRAHSNEPRFANYKWVENCK